MNERRLGLSPFLFTSISSAKAPRGFIGYGRLLLFRHGDTTKSERTLFSRSIGKQTHVEETVSHFLMQNKIELC